MTGIGPASGPVSGPAVGTAVGAGPHAAREATTVELVDENGTPRGEATVDLAHRAPGMLHRAFSVLLIDPDGRLLLQQRAAGKTRFALRWANACCGHPGPGEPVAVAAARRLAEELGVTRVPLAEIGVYRYRAADPASDRVEHEYDHVLVGELSATPRFAADPHEVADLRWVRPDLLVAEMAAVDAPALDAPGDDGRYAPWLRGVVATWRGDLDLRTVG